MNPITITAPKPSQSKQDAITAGESRAAHKAMTVAYVPSSKFTFLDVIVMQFWIHLILHSRRLADGSVVNDFTGKLVDGNGMFPLRKDAIMLNQKDHTFVLSEDGLPFSTPNNKWITGDPGRSTENPFLAALHLLFALVNNKVRARFNLNYEGGKLVTMGAIAGLIHTTFLKYGIDASDKPNAPARLRNVELVNTTDFAFGWGRAFHAQVPASEVTQLPDGKSIFDPVVPQDLYILERAGDIAANQLGCHVSDAMANMTHIPAPHDIRIRTGGQVAENYMLTYEELGMLFRIEPGPYKGIDGLESVPSFMGIIAESHDDSLGPLGTALMTLVAQQTFACAPGELVFKKQPDDRLYGDSIKSLIEFAEED